MQQLVQYFKRVPILKVPSKAAVGEVNQTAKFQRRSKR